MNGRRCNVQLRLDAQPWRSVSSLTIDRAPAGCGISRTPAPAMTTTSSPPVAGHRPMPPLATRVASDRKRSVNESARLLAILASRCPLSIAALATWCRARRSCGARSNETFAASVLRCLHEPRRGPMRADCIQPRAVRPAHRTHVDGLNPQRAFAPVCTTTHTAGANGLYWEYYPRFFLSADGTQFYGTMRALRSARLRYCNAGDGFGPQLAFSERLPVVAVRR